MNLQTRLDNVARQLPKPPAKANPFSDMSDGELDQLTKELAIEVQTQLDNDPNAINTINQDIIRLLKSEGLINV